MSILRRLSPLWLLLLGAAWWALAASHPGSWTAGAVAIGAGLLLHVGLGGRSEHRLSLTGLLVFVPYFLGRLVAGGADVARRAFSPSLPLDTGFVRHPIRLPRGLARIVFINAISLLPGTFSARVGEHTVLVHRLDPELAPRSTLEALEARVGRLFGIAVEGGAR